MIPEDKVLEQVADHSRYAHAKRVAYRKAVIPEQRLDIGPQVSGMQDVDRFDKSIAPDAYFFPVLAVQVERLQEQPDDPVDDNVYFADVAAHIFIVRGVKADHLQYLAQSFYLDPDHQLLFFLEVGNEVPHAFAELLHDPEKTEYLQAGLERYALLIQLVHIFRKLYHVQAYQHGYFPGLCERVELGAVILDLIHGGLKEGQGRVDSVPQAFFRQVQGTQAFPFAFVIPSFAAHLCQQRHLVPYGFDRPAERRAFLDKEHRDDIDQGRPGAPDQEELGPGRQGLGRGNGKGHIDDGAHIHAEGKRGAFLAEIFKKPGQESYPEHKKYR